MCRKIQTLKTLATLAIVIALCGTVPVTQAQAAPQEARSVSQISVAPPGPEADPYLEHYHGTGNSRYADVYWSKLWLNGRDPAQVIVAPPGPEADPYLEHYQGTASSRYRLPAWPG